MGKKGGGKYYCSVLIKSHVRRIKQLHTISPNAIHSEKLSPGKLSILLPHSSKPTPDCFRAGLFCALTFLQSLVHIHYLCKNISCFYTLNNENVQRKGTFCKQTLRSLVTILYDVKQNFGEWSPEIKPAWEAVSFLRCFTIQPKQFQSTPKSITCVMCHHRQEILLLL